jgi:fatty acid elongase 3
MELYNKVSQYISEFQWVTGKTFMSSFETAAIGCVLYVVSLIVIQRLMRNREPIRLDTINLIHNIFLCVASLVMLSGLVITLLWITIDDGFVAANCDPERKYVKGALPFWSYVFYLSKYYEWFDTVFLALKKKHLSFLHTYHHFITLWICWIQLATDSFTLYEPLVLNSLVHCFMYYYYACQLLEVPVWWKRHLTLGQMVQFLLDIVLTIPKAYMVHQGRCTGSVALFFFASFNIGAYFFLFLNFYRKTYNAEKADQKRAGTQKKLD